MKYSRAQRKRVLVKRKEPKGFKYVGNMLEAMVDRRRSVTLATPATQRQHRYVNPTDAPTAEEKARLLAKRAAHSRF